jgi:uncharacterized protein YbjT (DUF2867 family)
MNDQRTVLVIGATGRVGRHVVSGLLCRGERRARMRRQRLARRGQPRRARFAMKQRFPELTL